MPSLYKSVRYALKVATPTPQIPARAAAEKPRHRGWLLLLALPYLGLCFPGIYARATPALLGFPFFYWYQFAWVLATSCLLGVVYVKLRRAE